MIPDAEICFWNAGFNALVAIIRQCWKPHDGRPTNRKPVTQTLHNTWRRYQGVTPQLPEKSWWKEMVKDMQRSAGTDDLNHMTKNDCRWHAKCHWNMELKRVISCHKKNKYELHMQNIHPANYTRILWVIGSTYLACYRTECIKSDNAVNTDIQSMRRRIYVIFGVKVTEDRFVDRLSSAFSVGGCDIISRVYIQLDNPKTWVLGFGIASQHIPKCEIN